MRKINLRQIEIGLVVAHDMLLGATEDLGSLRNEHADDVKAKLEEYEQSHLPRVVPPTLRPGVEHSLLEEEIILHRKKLQLLIQIRQCNDLLRGMALDVAAKNRQLNELVDAYNK